MSECIKTEEAESVEPGIVAEATRVFQECDSEEEIKSVLSDLIIKCQGKYPEVSNDKILRSIEGKLHLILARGRSIMQMIDKQSGNISVFTQVTAQYVQGLLAKASN